MIKPGFIGIILCAALFAFASTPALSQGFSTLKAAGQGLDNSGDEEEGDGKKGSGKSSGGGKTTGGSGKAGKGDYVFLGVFETYIPSIRSNARMTVFGNPAEFKYAKRTCQRIRQVRDRINTELFKNPPEVNSRGKVNPEGLDKGIRKAVKRAMKTKREYFTSFYVVNGRFSNLNVPKELEGKPVSDCAGVIAKAKELEKGK